ncbi:hypothetical protein [Azospirillum sp. TSO35-2]|uniref:hypothetical protein n=1 Tax=Azospirillum sp. TSO35-2 TaxID=716796 RepID=UPI000D6142A0|nr:hypothetical protein [Azospirillum sp. TSO35-2]PWC31085.1 hypothetical protein TSO352_30090 [Azospirillum sp. TSO35-2]
MIDTQALLFLALTGMIGHAVYMASGRGSNPATPPETDETEDDAFSSDRFQQSAKGEERPFWLE